MKINKALVKHEWRNMKWMLLYFTIVSIGYIVVFSTDLNSYYLNRLSYGMEIDRSIIMETLRRMNEVASIPFGLGILLMIFMQFKDSKSLEVGRFLKSLPITNREYHVTKIFAGILSYTLPFIILVIGVLSIRANNMEWINDIKNVTTVADIFIKADSTLNTVAILLLFYLIISATYTFLFMMQYLVMNIVAGIVIGILVWLSPTFIIMSSYAIYSDYFRIVTLKLNIERNIIEYIQPWAHHITTRYHQLGSLNMIKQDYSWDINIHEGLLTKILINIIITVASIVLAYILAKKSKIEDSDTMITFKLAKKIFIVGVTVCSALLGGIVTMIFFGNYNDIGFIVLHIIMAISGVVGFGISRKISKIGVR